MDTSMFEEASDDEIFFGKMTLKEVRKILSFKGPSKKYDTSKKNDLDSSLRLIETHSAPNLRSLAADSPISSPLGSLASDDSFIQIENMISLSTNSNFFDNTLEVIDFVLNNLPNKKDLKEDENKSNKIVSPLKINSKNTPVKDIKQTESDIMGSPYNFMPNKLLSMVATPSASSKTPEFKTPANPSARKKPATLGVATPRQTPGKKRSYQHISSPIAMYIKNTPQVPLVKDVHPKKPLPGASSIPTLIKVTKNKENIHLPFVAYKSAKTTKVVQIPDQDKLPQSQWAKKMTSSSSRPTVMKHENRKMNPIKQQLLSHQPDQDKLPQSQWAKKITSSSSRPTVMKHENRKMNPIKQQLLSNQEHSFANLSCHQAEVSFCTEKTAFKSTNKYYISGKEKMQ